MPPQGEGSAGSRVADGGERVMLAILGPALSILLTIALLSWLIGQDG